MPAVESAMRRYAHKGKFDKDLWEITGLLHDFDYEGWPNPELDESGHPYTGVKILRELGYPEEMPDAILGHAECTGEPRSTPLAKTLFAVDEVCVLIMAAGYLRREHLRGLSPKSV